MAGAPSIDPARVDQPCLAGDTAKMTFADGRVTSLGQLDASRARQPLGELCDRDTQRTAARRANLQTTIRRADADRRLRARGCCQTGGPNYVRCAWRRKKGLPRIEERATGRNAAIWRSRCGSRARRRRAIGAPARGSSETASGRGLPPGASATDRAASTRARRQA